MPDSLSIAIGTVLSCLEIAEAAHGHVTDVNLVKFQNQPTNIIEFTHNGRRFEVLVNEKRHTPRMRTRPSTHKVTLGIQTPGRKSREQLTLTL